jgi:hypothetical protein
MTDCERPSLSPVNLQLGYHRKHAFVDVFTYLLLSTENKSRYSYLASPLTC